MEQDFYTSVGMDVAVTGNVQIPPDIMIGWFVLMFVGIFFIIQTVQLIVSAFR